MLGYDLKCRTLQLHSPYGFLQRNNIYNAMTRINESERKKNLIRCRLLFIELSIWKWICWMFMIAMPWFSTHSIACWFVLWTICWTISLATFNKEKCTVFNWSNRYLKRISFSISFIVKPKGILGLHRNKTHLKWWDFIVAKQKKIRFFF